MTKNEALLLTWLLGLSAARGARAEDRAAGPARAELGPTYGSLSGLARGEEASRVYENGFQARPVSEFDVRQKAGAPDSPLKAPAINRSRRPSTLRAPGYSGPWQRWGYAADWGDAGKQFLEACALSIILGLIFPHGMTLAAVLIVVGACVALALYERHKEGVRP